MYITDATPSGAIVQRFSLETLTETMTAREVIRARIWQEVQDYNQRCSELFRGLVQPEQSEATPGGYRMNGQRVIDWECQFRRACEAFERNGFFLLVGDRQAEELDESFEVGPETEIQFVRLTPLVGG